MPKVIIPPPYRGPTEGTGEVVVEGQTVLECLEAVDRKFPGFLPLLLTPDGSVHRFVKLFLNRDRLDGEVLGAAVGAEDEVEIVAGIAGG